MALFMRSLHPVQISRAFKALGAIQARQAHWFPDFVPGPYPKTEEERRAAAKKYNLLPEEYEPYPMDGMEDDACGDYPKLPFESVDSRDPYHNWDDPELRRDFMEPVNKRIVNLLPEVLSTGKRALTPFQAWLMFFRTATATLLIFLFLDQFKVYTPAAEKQLIQPGVKHYTFEIDEEELKRRKKKKIICKEED